MSFVELHTTRARDSIARNQSKYLFQLSMEGCFCQGCGAMTLPEQWWYTVYNREANRYYKCCSSHCMTRAGDSSTSCT